MDIERFLWNMKNEYRDALYRVRTGNAYDTLMAVLDTAYDILDIHIQEAENNPYGDNIGTEALYAYKRMLLNVIDNCQDQQCELREKRTSHDFFHNIDRIAQILSELYWDSNGIIGALKLYVVDREDWD